MDGADSPPALLRVERSLTGRRWTGPDRDIARRGLSIAQNWGLPEMIGAILAARGAPDDGIEAYLAPALRDLMPDPSTVTDMDTAAGRLAHAVTARQRVALFGDYDVDGGASCALMQRWLRALGTDATVYIPDRIEEGYGPNEPAMRALADAHDLILCLDCGTLSHDAIAAAGGADVVVIDHHLAGETLPDCLAVVNPNRQDDGSGLGHLCAAGMVFLTLVAAQRCLRQSGFFDGRKEPRLLDLLDLVALATVADVAPLTGLNRAFVRQGLAVMARRGNAGLRALADVAGLHAPPVAWHLGFMLGPRVNAGGRVGEAGLGARLLACDDPEAAREMAEVLDAHNTDRRAIEAAVLDAAIEQVEARGTAPGALVWAAGEGWHPGVVGIVASRLKERYNRPAIVIGLQDGIGKGSGRSVAGVDLGHVIQTAAREGLLLKGGGHRMAAGLTVEATRLEAALERIEAALARQGAGQVGARALMLDGALTPSGATLDFCEMLERCGPFGAGAPEPRFAFPAARITAPARAGETHLRLALTDEGRGRLDAIAFRAFEGPLGEALTGLAGRPVHLAGRLQIDDWRGRRRPKLHIEDAAIP